MSSTRNQDSFDAQPTQRIVRTTLCLLLAAAPFAAAQTPLTSTPAADVIAANVRFDLPDSPGTLFTSASSSADTNSPDANSPDPNSADPNGAGQTTTTPQSRPKGAGHLQFVINPGEIAEKMTVREKVLGGMINSVSLYSATGWLAAAGWEQLWNSSPNYGTDSGAFGERLGAAALRGVSEGVFSSSLFAPLFHEDPRYYVMGPGHGFLKRASTPVHAPSSPEPTAAVRHPTSLSSPATWQAPPSPSPTIHR